MYFEQRIGASHALCWSKKVFLHLLVFYIFYVKREKYPKKEVKQNWLSPGLISFCVVNKDLFSHMLASDMTYNSKDLSRAQLMLTLSL